MGWDDIFTPRILEIPHPFMLLAVNRDDGVVRRVKSPDRFVDMLKLRIPI
jgi:hypothetical protein